MDVLYDAGPYGRGRYEELVRTGIHRYIAELLPLALRDPRIHACATAFGALENQVGLAQRLAEHGAIERLRSPRRGGRMGHLVAGRLRQALAELHLRHRRGHPLRTAAGGAWRLACMTMIDAPLRGSWDVFHSLFAALPPRAAVSARARVLTVHDAIPARFPQWFTPDVVAGWHATAASVDPARDHVICVSHSTLRDFVAVTGFPAERAEVIPLGVHERFRPISDPAELERVRRRYGLPDRPFALSLSALEPRKNLRLLARAVVEAGAELGDAAIVVAGPTGWLVDDLLADLRELAPLRERVQRIGFVADEDLPALYSLAAAFIYPSRYEGFGLPPLEAMACGAPVIACGASSLPEVVGDAAILVEPDDHVGLARAIGSLMADPAARAERSRRGRTRAAGFSWRRALDRHVEFYRRIT